MCKFLLRRQPGNGFYRTNAYFCSELSIRMVKTKSVFSAQPSFFPGKKQRMLIVEKRPVDFRISSEDFGANQVFSVPLTD